MKLTNEVASTMLMERLPVGGTMERIACGSTTRKSVLAFPMPSDRAASVWPLFTCRTRETSLSSTTTA